MQAVPTYFSSILTDTPLDQSTADVSWVEYRTTDLNISSGSGPFLQSTDNYQIVVKNTDAWLHMHKAYLLCKFRLVTAADAATNAEVVTMGAASAGLFARMELSANDSQIDICENPQFVQLVNALLEMNRDRLESVAESEWLMIDGTDTVGGLRDGAVAPLALRSTTYAGTQASTWEHGSGSAFIQEFIRHTAGATPEEVGARHPNFNRGFALRWNKTRAGRVAEVAIPLSAVFGFCRDIQSVHRGIKWELNLTKNIRFSSIMHGLAGTGLGFKTVITKISLWVPQITPALETSQMLEASLNSKVLSKQYFENMTCRFSEQYPQNSVEVEWLVPTEGHNPTRMVFGVQRLAQFNSQNDVALLNGNNYALMDQTHSNPSTFSYLGRYAEGVGAGLVTDGIVECELRINQKSLPREKYRISFADETPEYQRNYVDLLKSSGKWADGDGASISMKEYKDLYPLFAFDLRDFADVFSGLKQNDVRLRMRIAGAGAVSDFRIVCVMYSQRELVVQPINGKLSLKV